MDLELSCDQAAYDRCVEIISSVPKDALDAALMSISGIIGAIAFATFNDENIPFGYACGVIAAGILQKRLWEGFLMTCTAPVSLVATELVFGILGTTRNTTTTSIIHIINLIAIPTISQVVYNALQKWNNN